MTIKRLGGEVREVGQLPPEPPRVWVNLQEARGRWSRRLTDDDLARLRPHLEALSRLEQLDLTNADITDAGLMELRGLTHLKILFLGKTRFDRLYSPKRLTESGVNKIRKALPNAKVFFSD